MASQGNTQLLQGIPPLSDAFVVCIATEWNATIIAELLAGATKVLQLANAEYKVLYVPGAVELTFAVQSYYKNATRKPDAFITLGTVIKGDTPHFEYVCSSVTQGITQLNATMPVPTIFGVLTVFTEEQAWERLGGKHGHKGEEAAITALKMIAFNQQLFS
jgi:6,7-dimethyl-8-ribityllumazine synthase